MKLFLSLLLAALTCDCVAQSSDKLPGFDPKADQYLLHPNVLVVLKESYNLQDRLAAAISQVASNSVGHEGAGEPPKSVCEAAEFIEHSTHMREGIHHGIEYRGYYIFSDVMPRDLKEWMLAGNPQQPNASKVFTSGYVVRKGEKMIHPFQLAVEKSKRD